MKHPSFASWTAYPDQWINYEDGNGRGWAQIDLLLVNEEMAVILDAKRTYRPSVRPQILDLYRPLVAHLFPDSIVAGVAACRFLAASVQDRVIRDIDAVFDHDDPLVVWHFMG